LPGDREAGYEFACAAGRVDLLARHGKRLSEVLAPLSVARMPLAEPPPRDNRFGSPLKLSRVHWVRPEVVVEVTYLTWTEGGLLRAVSYQGQREDKPARQVVRPIRIGAG
jgi:ATP-dependent DNA ligase